MKTATVTFALLLWLTTGAWAEGGATLVGQQLTGWEMMEGDAGRTEVLAFHSDGRLTLSVAGADTVEGSWVSNGDGAYCVSLPGLASCFEPSITGNRASVTLHDADGQLRRMWTGELSPIP